MTEIGDVPFSSKIRTLFEYRGIPELLDIMGIPTQDFEYHLFALQSSIYFLDEYLETTWELDDQVIDKHWSEMKSQLSYFVSEDHLLDKYLYQISVYLKREVGLRNHELPLNTSLRHFYYYKSCDVRLIRRLIHDHCVQFRSKLDPVNWLIYDLITEVNDDVEDLSEDLGIYNCNRLLFECLVNGVQEAGELFKTFIGKLSDINGSRDTSFNIRNETNTIISDTKELLNQRLKWIETVDLQDSMFLTKIKG